VRPGTDCVNDQLDLGAGPEPVRTGSERPAAADLFRLVVLLGHRGHHGAADPHLLRPPEQLVHPLLPESAAKIATTCRPDILISLQSTSDPAIV
jgi:hypothetical protein